jgi:hypothetical protein
VEINRPGRDKLMRQNPFQPERRIMTKRVIAVLSILMFCGVILSQEPVVDINQKFHPNLYQAQQLVAQANHYIVIAQKDNRYDMHGHASKARQLLAQANQELKAAAEDANRK